MQTPQIKSDHLQLSIKNLMPYAIVKSRSSQLAINKRSRKLCHFKGVTFQVYKYNKLDNMMSMGQTHAPIYMQI